MSTVGQVVDRVFRDFLHGGDEQPLRTRVTDAAGITSSATSLTFDDTMLSVDEQESLAVGTVIEAAREQMLIRAVSGTTLTVTRAVNGTTAVTHAQHTMLVIQPTFYRQTVFDAVCDAVDGLYPDLYRVATQTVTTGTYYTEVAAAAVTPLHFRWADGDVWVAEIPHLLSDFPESSTTKAVVGLPSGKTGYFTYRGEFDRPSSEADELSSLGVRAEWEKIVVVDAAASVLGGTTEVAPVTQEFITEALAAEAAPVGSAGKLADRLLRWKRLLIADARRQLVARDRPPVTFMPVDGVV